MASIMASRGATFKSIVILATILSSSLIPLGHCAPAPAFSWGKKAGTGGGQPVNSGEDSHSLSGGGALGSDSPAHEALTALERNGYFLERPAAGRAYDEVRIWHNPPEEIRQAAAQPGGKVKRPSALRVGYGKATRTSGAGASEPVAVFRRYTPIGRRRFAPDVLVVMSQKTPGAAEDEAGLALSEIMKNVWTGAYSQKVEALRWVMFDDVDDQRTVSAIITAGYKMQASLPSWTIKSSDKRPNVRMGWEIMSDAPLFRAVRDMISARNQAGNKRGITSISVKHLKQAGPNKPSRRKVDMAKMTIEIASGRSFLDKISLKGKGSSSSKEGKYGAVETEDGFEGEELPSQPPHVHDFPSETGGFF